MTEEQLKTYIVERLKRRYSKRFKEDDEWAWGLVKEAVKGLNAGQRIEIINTLRNTSVIKAKLQALATDEAAIMMENKSLDLAELSRILGDD